MKNRVRIIAPASRHKEDSKAILKKGVELLEQAGFIVSIQENIFAPSLPGFYASPKENRYLGLKESLESDEVDIIWCFRGGYGCGEIADLCMDITPNGDKVLIGFSDITYLHFLFNQHYKMPSIHGPVITSLALLHPEAIEDIVSILKGEKQQLQLEPLNDAAQQDIKGELIGGNLTIFTTMIGTALQPDTKNKILLLEEVNEAGYQVARALNHIEKASLLGELAGVIFGDFIGSDQYLDNVIKAFISSHKDLPIYRAKNIGHGDKNKAILLGQEIVVKSGILEYSLIDG